MLGANQHHQYPPSVQTMRNVDAHHHDNERETLPHRQRNGGVYDGSLSPVTVKDFQDHHQGPTRRPSTPNFDRLFPKTGPLPPLPDPRQHFKHPPPRNE